MLRQWRTALSEVSPRPRSAGSAGTSPASPITSPADQAAEIARPRRELDVTRMERDVQKKRSASSRGFPRDVHLHRAACTQRAGASHLPRARSVPPAAPTAGDRVLRAPGGRPSARSWGCPACVCRASQAPRRAARVCCPARRGPHDEPRASGAPDAPSRHSGSRGAAVPTLRDRQPSRRPVVWNLLKQDFPAGMPNTIWLADITCLPTGEGWLYLAAALDLATRKIVGWAMRDHMRAELTLAAPMMATLRQRPAAGLIRHSDRGSRYAAGAYREQLAGMGARPSKSRAGRCYDDAPMESFFHTLKVELVDQRRGATRDDARRDLFAYIEGSTIGDVFIQLSATSHPSTSRGMRDRARIREGEDHPRIAPGIFALKRLVCCYRTRCWLPQSLHRS